MGGSSAREIDMEGMDRFVRAIDEDEEYGREIVGGLIHKECLRRPAPD